MLLLLLGLACGPSNDEVAGDTLDAREAEARAEALQTAQAEGTGPADGPKPVEPVEGAEPVELVLVWQGIGNLHRSFFSNSDSTTALSAGLAGRVKGPANIYVRHDAEEFVGSIRLQLRPDTLLSDVGIAGNHVQLQDLSPITRALAAYRSHVASRTDFRIESFHVGIESFRGPKSCIFGVAGTPPPDGSLVDPCVELGGQEVCGVPEPEGVRFPADAVATIKRCLDL